MHENILLRPAGPKDAPGIAKVHIDTWRSAFTGIMPEDFLKSLSIPDYEEHHAKTLADQAKRQGWFVAESKSKGIIGFACGWRCRDADPRYDAELYAMYILDSFQGLGLGRNLMTHFVSYLSQRGFKSLKLWVLKDNSARGFYESLGGTLLKEEKKSTFGKKELVEVAYGWESLKKLSEKLEEDAEF